MRICLFKTPAEINNVTEWHFLDPPRKEYLRRSPVRRIDSVQATWQPLRYEVVTCRKAPDIFHCRFEWMVPETVIKAISSRVGDDVEFLPIDCDLAEPLYLIHPLRLVPLGPNADVSMNPVSQSITWIHKYDFQLESLSGVTIFQVEQPPGSMAANAGSACGDVLVSGEIADILIERGFQGVDLVTVFEVDD